MLWRGPIGGGAASGRVGAFVASRAKTTQYLRARVTPVNPRSVFQAAVRDSVKTLVGRWATVLTDEQREAWNTYASNVTRKNRLGDTINITGIAWYVGNNTPRLQAGLAVVDSLGGPLFAYDLGNPNFGATDWDAAGTNGTINWAGSPSAIANDTTSEFLVYASKPYNPGRARPVAGNRLAAVIPGNSTAGSSAITLPFPLVDSQSKMDLEIRLSRGDGRLSSSFRFPFSP